MTNIWKPTLNKILSFLTKFWHFTEGVDIDAKGRMRTICMKKQLMNLIVMLTLKTPLETDKFYFTMDALVFFGVFNKYKINMVHTYAV